MLVNKAVERANFFLKMYENAEMTKWELINKLVFVASEFQPKEFKHILPDEIIEELSKESFRGIADPQDVFLIQPGYYRGTKHQLRKSFEKRDKDYFLGLNAFHHYFHPNIPIPPFEERKFVGKIDEKTERKQYAIIVGVFDFWLINRNQIEIIDTKNNSLFGYVLRQTRFAPYSDLKDERLCLYLTRNIKVEDIEIGSEVWVHRKKTIIENLDLEKA